MYASNFFQGWEKVTATRKPWIAAVAGYALGGGCEVAMMADFIIAADNAQFGQPEIKLGVTPGMGGSQRLTHAIGKAKSMEMCLTGRMMGAEEAERAGLVGPVVDRRVLGLGVPLGVVDGGGAAASHHTDTQHAGYRGRNRPPTKFALAHL